jgi:hypothetical protein
MPHQSAGRIGRQIGLWIGLGAEQGHCRSRVFILTISRHSRLTGIYARWHMFEEKREAVMAIEAAVFAVDAPA